jgi:hypothetical protein
MCPGSRQGGKGGGVMTECDHQPDSVQSIVAHLALGDLIRILSTIDQPSGRVYMLAAEDFLAWFHDRFHLPAGACSSKAFGDALTFAIRLGLVPLKKIVRTKRKLIFYAGIDNAGLEEALERWKGPHGCQGYLHSFTETIGTVPASEEFPPLPPWDVDREPVVAPELQWEAFDLAMMEGGSEIEEVDF